MITLGKTYRWAVLYSFFLLTTACWFSSDERITVEEDWPELNQYPRGIDLREIMLRGKLVVLTQGSTNSYFLYKGEAMGFEYELLADFAKDLGLELEVIIARNNNGLLDSLQSGAADLIATNLAVTASRNKLVSFTEPILYSKQVLVQRNPTSSDVTPLLHSPLELSGKNVFVHKKSSFYSRLKHLNEEIGGTINILEAPGGFTPERLIQMVAEGHIDYTVADEHVALLNQGYFPNINIEVAVSFPQKIAWACRKESPQLLKALNSWLKKTENKRLMAVLRYKYFKALKTQRERFASDFSSLSGGKISQYDDLIRKYSPLLGWDWRIIAAQMAQESQFNPHARSWAGAFGLMQLMPQTAAQFGVDSSSSAEEQIRAGVHYMMWLDTYWQNEIPNDQERIKFVLASYNVGLGHVIDARSLTEVHGGDSNTWENHVDYYLRNKSSGEFQNSEWVKYGYCRCTEPVEYVEKILDRYAHYTKLIS